MEKILVTGASGFVGRNLIRHLNGYEVLPAVKGQPCQKNAVFLDFESDDFDKKVQQLPKVKTCIHLGAKVDWKATPEELYKPNVLSAKVLAKWCAKTGAHMIFASTISVYGGSSEKITDSTMPAPSDAYGQSKLDAENEIKKSGAKYTIIRFPGIYGLDGPAHLGINTAIKNAVNGIAPEQKGPCKMLRNYAYVGDVCRAILHCINKGMTGTHLYGGPAPVSVFEMLRSICDVFLPGKKPKKTPGNEGRDCIIAPSASLPAGMEFKESLYDMQQELKK